MLALTGKRRPTQFVVTCKGCARAVPVACEMPRDNIVVDCPLCGELRRYRPSEVYKGYPDGAFAKQAVTQQRKRIPYIQ